MQLFYQPNFEQNATNIVFDAHESKHMFKVLRKQVGDLIKVTNGRGLLAEGEISIITQKQCIVNVLDIKFETKKNYHIHIAISPTKSNDRFEWFLEKATEIGIDEITPIITEHSERKKLKLDRGERVIQSAMKQSLKLYKPKLNHLTKLNDLLINATEDEKYIAHCEESKHKKQLITSCNKQKSYLVLIGPEGDFSSQEIKNAINNNFDEVNLSQQRLRTETAAIVSTHSLNILQLL
ncbi:16S rRNA (uracil(1498)-N(3))-methyltransferase [Psychroflexus sp. ALD_RP9]|uniref:16S rRNA (uracil(1498)-N(3))-methyltransferase n=1 Tax=Psychroflexus sp. ALD_RP9 TaxID=2777186 RepID=UPI001A8F9B25|nr:16S rRNA (uracil(1498)-N(3))-methyltransferase [Psychroflexus sp. ALD_RP9]QSS97314.1 16S rRNA (uracil(1498)-N(3))-methyltransferase [Psychroflexus sp. ALD_RP9]